MSNGAPPFISSTRFKIIPLEQKSKPTGGGKTSISFPKTGILACIFLDLDVTITGTLSAPNALGLASIVRRIKVSVNSGHDLVDISGAGFHYLVRESIGDNRDHLSWVSARAAVTTVSAGTKISCIIPISMNMREELGLVMLQNEATLVTMEVDYEADATVATGATVVVTQKTSLGVFELPNQRESWPQFNTLHQLLEEQQTIAATGSFDHIVPRGATLAGLYYLCPAYTNAQLLMQQSNNVEVLDSDIARLRFDLTHGRNLDFSLAGSTVTNRRVIFDFAGSDEFGQIGTIRDFVDTNRLTDIRTRFTFSATGTLFAVRRQLLRIS
jgi:hypothetical protein